MLDTALDNIEQNGMLPEEFENKENPHFTIRLNIPCLPAETKSLNNKGYNHYKGQGKKAIRFEVKKEKINYLNYLSAQTHRLKLDVKYFGKFAKFMATLGSNVR
jgi:hypothetical protein